MTGVAVYMEGGGQKGEPNTADAKAALPKHAQLESVAKSTIAHGLEQATKDTKKGRYHKIRHASDILMRVNPDTVQRRCPHCKRMFDSVEHLIG